MQRHLGGHAWQRLHQEVGCPHAGLDRSERVFHRLAPLTHGLWIFIESALNGLEHTLVLPSGDPALFGCRATALDSTDLAGVRPIAAASCQPIFDVGV
jgi:hypothetical protein